MEKYKYWNPKEILKRNADYNIVFGERSNGKSYGIKQYFLSECVKNKKQFAVIRRWDEDLKANRAASYFQDINDNGVPYNLTKNFTKVIYDSRRWYLAKYDEKLKRDIKDIEPVGYAFTLSSTEHDKSTAYPNVDYIVFEEFMTRGVYRPNEFVEFMNTLSTIIRARENVKIFMLGNTVNQFCPYFNEMGLKNILKMNVGDINVYEYSHSKLRIAVEYSRGITDKGKPSDKLFSFDNPKLEMITRGSWEIPSYPHLMEHYEKDDILEVYFILFQEHTLQCEVIRIGNGAITYIHRKTTPIKDPDNDIIFTPEYSCKPNYRRDITNRFDNISSVIYSFFIKNKVFYQDNEVGEIVRNYLMWCKSLSIIEK